MRHITALSNFALGTTSSKLECASTSAVVTNAEILEAPPPPENCTVDKLNAQRIHQTQIGEIISDQFVDDLRQYII